MELKYRELQEIAEHRPELIPQLLELQQLAEEMGDDPEGWIVFALSSSAIGQAYVQVPKGPDRPWGGS